MINTIKIKNFQSHASTDIKLSSGVNTIIGSSDSGKSAIIRALRWLVWNRPSGDAIRSTWGGPTSVEVELAEGDILRNKDKTDHYQIHREGKALDFKAFGTSVPEEVIRALNISEVNIQNQLDSPFLLSDSSGSVAQYFNKVAKLDKIDISIKNVQKWIRELESTIKYKKEEIKGQREALKQYQYLQKFEVEVEVLENIEQELNTKRNQYNRLHKDIETIKSIQETLREYEDTLKLKEPVEKLLKLYEDKRNLESCEMLLSKAINTINNIQHKLEGAKAAHTDLLTKFRKVFPNVCPLCGSKVNSNNLKV